MSKNPRKRPSHAGIQNIKKNKAKKQSRGDSSHFNQQIQEFATSLWDQWFANGTPPPDPPSPTELLSAAQEGISNLSDVGGRALHSLGDAFWPSQGESSDNDLNSILNRAHFTPNNSSSPPDSSPPDRGRSPSPPRDDNKFDSDQDLESDSEEEKSDSDEEFQDADNDNPTPAAGRPRVEPPEPHVVHQEMSDIDSHHMSYNVTTVEEVWNDPTVFVTQGSAQDLDIADANKYGYAEIDAYRFQPVALWNNQLVTENGTRSRLQSLFNLYQEYRISKITASYYPNNNNVVTSPDLRNISTVQSQPYFYPNVGSIVYQPYNMCMRFDRNDAVPFDQPGSGTPTWEVLERIFVMESMNGTKCFRSDQPCTFSFEPTALAGIGNFSSAPAQPQNTSTTIAARPIESPWIPTKISNGSATVLNVHTLYFALKIGMYNLQIKNNIKKVGQVVTSTPSFNTTLRYAVQLGNLKISWRFEFRIREERPSVFSEPSLQLEAGPPLFERYRQNFPTTLDEEKSEDDMIVVAEKNLKRTAANASLEMM